MKSSISESAPVYMYFFSWQSPVLDGKYKAFHCMELPFIFDNIKRSQNMTGGGEKAQILADRMSQSWINFSRYGNPGHNKIPDWKAYSIKNGATMNFDNEVELWYHHDKGLLDLMNLDN